MVHSGHDFSKEQQDIALAAIVLQSGLLSERNLASAIATWTMHGSVSLADHLRSLDLLDETQRESLSHQAAEYLVECCDQDTSGPASQSVLLGTLNALDPGGTIARLLGIREAAGAGAVDSRGKRDAPVRYKLIRKLGQGGLGRVWLAFDENLKRHVALKEIAGSDNPAALERFRREAEITGRLEHPGIVPIYQLGDDSHSGEAFYAMRFLGKTTMHDAIMEYHERRSEGDDDPMLIRRLLTDFVSICQAIGHAHSRKVIHRDLKPENIAIDSFGQVIVIDWGIAKVIGEVGVTDNLSDVHADASSSQSTLEGQVLGTPLYMSPEQAAGRVDELDERTDIYGLGAILFAILTGNAPHETTRDAASATGNRELLSAISSQPTPTALIANPDVDPALAAICQKAMARRQYARYPSASQLADDVQRWMAGEQVSAYHERPLQIAARWVQHHRIWSQIIVAAAIIGVVALATLGIASHQGELAARQILFDEMRGFEREIKVQIEATAEDLAKDARFMSTLPPIQGIMDARSGTLDGESEEVWRGRLETIYEGLLRANPDYLSVSYVTTSEAPSGIVLVHLERHANDASYVRRVPAARLGEFANTELLQAAQKLPPGETCLVIRTPDSSAWTARHTVRLLAATPVYDESTGELFGLVVVETNLLMRLINFLETLDQQTTDIYVADSTGQVWVSDIPDEGVVTAKRATSVADFLPDTAGFFSSSDDERVSNRSQFWIASRIPLDPSNPEASVVLVLHLEDEARH